MDPSCLRFALQTKAEFEKADGGPSAQNYKCLYSKKLGEKAKIGKAADTDKTSRVVKILQSEGP
jgi:hypothetical protein